MFHTGQRWYSEGEPELGLGIVVSSIDKQVTINFPLTSTERTYSKVNPPLKRFLLAKGDEFIDETGKSAKVLDLKLEHNIYFYQVDSAWLSEVKINAHIDLSGPLERLLVQNFDSNKFFNLRYKAYLALRSYEQFEFKGFLGAKMSLIPHQIYLASEILSHPNPKYMLCDEVGLGKTIEAAIIIHALIQKDLISNTLIVVPESLVNQWFVELYKKFSLTFKTISFENRDEIDLEQAQHYIVSSSLLEKDLEVADIVKSIDWNMLVIDESHQISFDNPDSHRANLLKDITKKTQATLYLSATPEVLGTKNLFHQLNALDPGRYPNFEEFERLTSSSFKISELIRDMKKNETKPSELTEYFSTGEIESTSSDELAEKLVDRFGQGRSYFRNSRQALEKNQNLFMKRALKKYPISRPKLINDKIVLAQKVQAVFNILSDLGDEKVLILCHSKEMVKKTTEKLLQLGNFNIAEFHSEQSLLERDRQAAYFADPEGANILICTEIGSEGRNFEFAHNLILLDLPRLPDQLEQRIGRLDRIGQKNDILIHVPFILSSFEEVLLRWYDEVLESFTKFPKGGFLFYQRKKETIMQLIEAENLDGLDTKLKELKSEYNELQAELEGGRDFLIEQRSFNPEKASKEIEQIKQFEQKDDCRQFLDQVCAEIGIDFEPLNDHVYFMKPSDNMLIPSYPGLSNEGLSVTFDREYANRHINIDYMNWEHPIIKSAFELLLNSPLGNASIIRTSDLPRNIYFEFIVIIHTQGPNSSESSRYLPYTPFRAFIDIKGSDLTLKISKKQLDQISISKVDDEILSLIKNIPKEQILQLKKTALALTSPRVNKLKTAALAEVKEEYKNERERIASFKISETEKKELQKKLTALENAISSEIHEATISLDSLRIIFPSE